MPGEKLGHGDGVLRDRPPDDEEVPRKRLESSRFQEIPVRVELLVRFDLAGSPKADGKAEVTSNEPITIADRSLATGRRASCGAAALGLAAAAGRRARRPLGRASGQEKEVLPKHVTPETLRAVIKGLDYLAAKPGRRRLVDHRRRPGLPGRHDRPGRARRSWPTATRPRGASTRRTSRGPSSSWSAAPRRRG